MITPINALVKALTVVNRSWTTRNYVIQNKLFEARGNVVVPVCCLDDMQGVRFGDEGIILDFGYERILLFSGGWRREMVEEDKKRIAHLGQWTIRQSGNHLTALLY